VQTVKAYAIENNRECLAAGASSAKSMIADFFCHSRRTSDPFRLRADTSKTIIEISSGHRAIPHGA
jgi:hypothetical protein